MPTKERRARERAAREYRWRVQGPVHASLSAEQLQRLQALAGVYLADLHDPTAVEVLLILFEACRIVGLTEPRLAAIFGARGLHAVRAWGEKPPRRVTG
jgi:hypothetical protein